MRRAALALLLLNICLGSQEITRPVRTWEFLDVAGTKAVILGHEDGVLESYIYPLKIFKDLKLRFVLEGRVIPAANIVRRIVARPGSTMLIYTGDEFEVRETLIVPVDQPGGLIRIAVDAHAPLRVDVVWQRDFQLMWPASIGTTYGDWNEVAKAFVFGADGQRYAAVLGSPQGTLLRREYISNYGSESQDALTLGTVKGTAEMTLAWAGSMRSRDEALQVWRTLISYPQRVEEEAEAHYRAYLARTVQLELPDARLQEAYDLSRLSEYKGLVRNPLLGEGLIAGLGPSKGAYRPGYGWFFGRDTFWTSFALTSAGDFDTARAGIDFIAKFQRSDGKVPHEISQTASLVDWWKGFPWAYSSADATPLYVAAVRNYVAATGDLDFARKHWPGLNKAFAFMRANFEPHGYPKNLGVGHGWVEGGPLLPVSIEFYQAGAYLEALRSMAALARWLGDPGMAAQLGAEFDAKQKALETLFWLPGSKTYAFALGTNGAPVEQPTVLATVPMWFGLTAPDRSRHMIETLSTEDHESDWGMRIISTKNPLYGPEGYHFGSVWPLFTGWASVGEYRYHMPAPAYANLYANAWLALDGAAGNPTEVLSGMSYSPLTTASPHQIWSAAMVVSPLLRGLCGLDVNAPAHRVTLAPQLPADWPRIAVRNVPVAGQLLDFRISRDSRSLKLIVLNRGTAAVDVEFAPAYPPPARITSATYADAPVQWKETRTPTDWQPHFLLTAKPGESVLTLQHSGVYGYSVPYDPPQLGALSSNLKVISEAWNGTNLKLRVSGLASARYRIRLTGAAEDWLTLTMPAGAGYVNATFDIPFGGRTRSARP